MKNIILSAIAISVSISAFGWGQTGHRAIGKIAESYLSEKAKKSIQEIMGHESLAECSTWMDEVRSNKKYDYAKTWHYVTIPEGTDYKSVEHEEKGDVYEAIGRMKKILKDKSSTKEQKVEAIRMITHLVGDMHQPLHVGNGEDRGGNNVKIKWFYDDSNLHRIWDSGMIDEKKYSSKEAFFYSENLQLILNKYQSYSKKLLSNKDGYKKFNKENYLLQKISIEQTKKIFNKLFKSKIKKKEKGIIKIDAEGMDLVILRDILGSKVNVSNLIIIFENFSSKVDLKKIINDSKKKLYFYKIERNRKIEKFPFKFYSWILMIIFGSRMIISQVKDINNLQGNIIISTQNYKDKLK